MPHKDIVITTKKEREVVDITDQINTVLAESQAKTDIASIFLLHTTAGLTTTTLHPDVDLDILESIEIILPKPIENLKRLSSLPYYITSAFLGQHIALPVQDGVLRLGPLQRVIVVELNGPRERTIVVNWSKS